MLDYLIFAATVVIFLILAVIYLYPGSKKSTDIPGPEPVDPIEGNYPDIKACGGLHEFLVNLHGTYGPICSFWAGPQLCVSIASPELFEEQMSSFDRPVELFKAPTLLWGENSPFVQNGADGRKKHAFLTSMFNDAYMTFSLKLEQELLKKQTSLWLKWPNEQYFPLYEKVSALVFKFLLVSILGYISENNNEINLMKGNLDNVWIEVGHYIDDSPDADGLRDMRFEQYKKNLKSFISDALKSRKDVPSSDKVTKLPVDHVLQLTDEEAVTILLLIFTNAYLKYSSLFTWMGYFLALEPDVQHKLRKELGLLSVNELSSANINKFKYFQNILKETLRCAKIVPYTARIHNTDIVIKKDKIPANTPIIHALGVISGDATIFPEPDEFNPDRFDSKNKPKTFACQSFGFAGKRKCPASSIVASHAALFYSHLLDCFELKLAPDQIVSSHHGLNAKPKEEIWLSLELRKK